MEFSNFFCIAHYYIFDQPYQFEGRVGEFNRMVEENPLIEGITWDVDYDRDALHQRHSIAQKEKAS